MNFFIFKAANGALRKWWTTLRLVTSISAFKCVLLIIFMPHSNVSVHSIGNFSWNFSIEKYISMNEYGSKIFLQFPSYFFLENCRAAMLFEAWMKNFPPISTCVLAFFSFSILNPFSQKIYDEKL